MNDKPNQPADALLPCPWREELQKLVPDADIEKAFDGTNFGSGSPREIIRETLLQHAGDFATGYTAMRACQELGLLGKHGDGKVCNLTKKGKRYMFYAYRDKTRTPSPAALKTVYEDLESIVKWQGEFPETGRYWDEPKNTEPMSYSACYGSNGERDFMREKAKGAAALLKPFVTEG